MPKRVLIAFEFTGLVRDAFTRKGFEAWSIDVRETEIPSEYHKKANIYSLIDWIKSMNFDLLIAHPSCRYTSVSGNGTYADTELRLRGIKQFIYWDTFVSIPRRAIEHPVSVISTHHRKPTQYIQPYQFGHGETKKTGLWLTNLPKLYPTNEVEGREERIWKMSPGKNRSKDRSRTYLGIAQAMADQWSKELL